MWIILILVLTVSYACGNQVRINPAPFADVDENSNVTLTCDYNGTLAPLKINWYSYNLDHIEDTWLNMSCIPIYGTSSQNKTFTCDESIGKFQMTIRNVDRDRDGQLWHCLIELSNNTYEYGKWTVLSVRGNLTETSCFKNNDAEICPHPVARVKENETLVITVKMNVSSVWRYVHLYEYTYWNFSFIHGSDVDHNCTFRNIDGIRPAGYNFTCNPSASITYTWDQVQRDMNDGTEQNTTNPVSTTMFPRNSSTAFTSMVPTSQLPPFYVPDPGEYELHLEFDLKVEMEYNETYKDKTSHQFQSLAKIFSISLTEVFKNITGFKSIDILRFSPGSVHVDYVLNVFGTVDVATVTKEIRSNIVSNFTSIAGVPVITAYTYDSIIRRLDNMTTRDKCSLASTYLCLFGYYCKPAIASPSVILCIHRCNSSVCQNNEECYTGHHSHDVQCRCSFAENVVYSGQRCEIKTGVVTVQERHLYLIFACAIVVGILLVFISTVCVINRKRNRLKKRLTSSHVLQLDEMHKRSNNGVPAMDERYVLSLNPALGRYPEGYCGGRVNVSYQDQGLDGGYLQVRDCARRNSDEDYDYISPELEVGSRSQHN